MCSCALEGFRVVAPFPLRWLCLAQIWAVHEALSAITPNFSIAAAFGNIHSSHNPGNVKLKPGILAEHQASER